MPNLRSCLVSFAGTEGIEHTVRFPAESLYEAAIEAMAAFRHSVLADMPFGPATRLTVRVKAPEEEYTLQSARPARW